MAIPPWLIQNPAIEDAVRELLKSGAWSQYEGTSSHDLTGLLSQSLDRKHVQLCCSGTIAVELALRGVAIQPEDEVILAAYDFPGNFRAIESIGARPVLVDIESDRWTLDPQQLDEAYSDRVRAILVSHLHGTMADLPKIIEWARTKNIAVIEDACQAQGGSIEGKPAGSWGDVSVTSFGGSKLITSGRGGAIFTNDPRIDQRIRIFRDRGNDAFPMSELQACVLRAQWESLPGWTEIRLRLVRELESRLVATEPTSSPRFFLPRRDLPHVAAFYKWGIRIAGASLDLIRDQRSRIISRLRTQGVECGEGFRGFVSRSERRCRSVGDFPNARLAVAGTLLIHHTHFLSADETIPLADKIRVAFETEPIE